MTRFLASVLASVALLGGCASSVTLSQQMAAWQNGDIDSALQTWGEPDDRMPDGDETIFIWRDRAMPPIAFSAEPAALPVVCVRMLAVGPDGTVTGWRWRGDACGSLPVIRGEQPLVASNGSS